MYKNIAGEDVVGKCPHCRKELTWGDVKEGTSEKGRRFSTVVHSCPHCLKVISISDTNE